MRRRGSPVVFSLDLTAPPDTLDATGVTGMIERLRELGGPVDEAEAIDEIAALERLKSAAAAAQARVTAAAAGRGPR